MQIWAKQSLFWTYEMLVCFLCKPANQGIPKSRAFWEKGAAIRTVKPFLNENGEPKGFAVTWRSGWDSNPRTVARQLISSQSRYDHFDTTPNIKFLYVSPDEFGKTKI